jgi:GAF domain-containing protein
MMPAAASVVFGYDRDTDELRARAVAGLHENAFYSVRILNGERLTGWVAAHRQPIVNSDANLDLADTPLVKMTPAFSRCVAVPIVRGDDVLGALAVYSVGASEFTAEDASTLQAVADRLMIDRG